MIAETVGAMWLTRRGLAVLFFMLLGTQLLTLAWMPAQTGRWIVVARVRDRKCPACDSRVNRRDGGVGAH